MHRQRRERREAHRSFGDLALDESSLLKSSAMKKASLPSEDCAFALFMVTEAQGGHGTGGAAVYSRAVYPAYRRRALDLWAEHLEAALKGRETAKNVVAFSA